MKKILIILALLLVLIWLIVMPALVGSYLDRAVPVWLDEAGMQKRSQFDSGWFTSTLQVDKDYALDLSARHVPPLSLSWVHITGDLRTSFSSAPLKIDGEFSLTGLSSVTIQAAELRVEGPVQLDSGPARLALEQGLDQASQLSWRVDALELSDQLGNALPASAAKLALGWQPADSSRDNVGQNDENRDLDLTLAVVLDAETGPLPALRLDLEASPVQRDVLGDLLRGLQQMAQAPTDSTAQQFALLTVVGAWQQLVQSGMTIRLEGLQIGSENQFSGRWTSEGGSPVLTGAGSIESLARALQPVVGLSARVGPATAERSVRAWLDQLSQRGWLVVKDDQFNFQYPVAEG